MAEQKKQPTEKIIDYSKFTDFEISIIAANRDIQRYAVECWDELLNAIGQAKGFEDSEKKEAKKQQQTAVSEVTFTILKFEPQQGAKLGVFEVAYKQNCAAEKFQYAFEILSKANATIQSRYRGDGYLYSYWIYGESKIYRQQLKGAATH